MFCKEGTGLSAILNASVLVHILNFNSECMEFITAGFARISEGRQAISVHYAKIRSTQEKWSSNTIHIYNYICLKSWFNSLHFDNF